MEYLFHAIADVVYEPNLTTSSVCIYQDLPDQPPIVIGYIHDTLEYGELRNTHITYAGGSLDFVDDYDVLLPPEHYFWNQSNNTALCLDQADQGTYLRNGDDAYPIRIEHDQHGQFTQIILFYAASADGFQVPYTRITRTLIRENRLEYEIRTDGLPDTPLLMAMTSLPFTTGNLMPFGSHLKP